MNIIIDTSILRKDRGFLNSDILLIKKLAKLDLLKIHFPWIVFKESISQNLLEVKNGIDNAIKEISSLNRKGIDIEEYEKLKEVTKALESINSKTEKSIEKHWERFINDSKAILHEINEEHGKKVMTSYFLGTKPFPVPKSRKDIPDAFIYEAILTINEIFGKTCFICDDKNLRESIAKNEDCQVFKTYEEFFDSDIYKLIDSEYKKIEHYVDELIVLKENIDKIEKYAKEELYRDLFAGDEQVIVHENIPSDGNEGALQDIEGELVETIQFDKIQFVDGVFYIPIEMKACFRIEYFLFKADYYIYEERNISIIDHDWNKHYYLVEESFNASLSFKCTIEQENIKNGEFEFDYEPAVIDKLEIIEK
ncbi:MAG: DUF4935 domain-containing protein [Taibaiella sp.]|nr:DUF4935 domain-containing protein [Taibaiella sp.]